jgi:hypothetical protein
MSGLSMVKVQLRGSAEAILARDSIELACTRPLSLEGVARALAEQDDELARQLLHEDGNPRRAVKYLIDASVAESFDAEIPEGARIAVMASLPCDG